MRRRQNGSLNPCAVWRGVTTSKVWQIACIRSLRIQKRWGVLAATGCSCRCRARTTPPPASRRGPRQVFSFAWTWARTANRSGWACANTPLPCAFQDAKCERRKARGWRLAGFSKTQYASLHGWEHFQRCHCTVVNLLAASRTPELRVKISDEGDYWPRRSLAKLRQNLDHMNGLVAAAAGALKDHYEGAEGAKRVQSPVFAHPQFERLEAEGAMRVAPLLNKLRAAVGKI